MLEDIVEIDPADQRSWICAQTGHSPEIVQTILDIEWEYMVGVGLVDGLPNEEFVFWFYDKTFLATAPKCVEPDLIAEDIEKYLKIPCIVSDEVFLAELRYMANLGLCDADGAGLPDRSSKRA